MTRAEREAEVAALIRAGWLDPKCAACRKAINARLADAEVHDGR